MYTPIRWQQRFQNLERAYLSLEESQNALIANPDNLFIRDSLIQRYEFTFELAWKTLKDYLEAEGFSEISSPRKTIRQAFQAGYIEDGAKWLKALDDRNKTSHIYNETMAKEITKTISEEYFVLIQRVYFYFKKIVNGLQ